MVAPVGLTNYNYLRMKARFAWNPHAAEFKPGQNEDGSPRISGLIENETEKEIDLLNLLKRLLHSGIEEENESDKDVSMGLTPTSAVHGPNLCNLTMSRQSTIHGQRRHTDAGELLLHLSCFISAFSLVACLDRNLIELNLIVKQKVKKFQTERSKSGKLESKILQLSEMLEEFLYCTYLRQASEQRLLAELARMCAEQSFKPQARATEKLDMDSLPLQDKESQTGWSMLLSRHCYQEWSMLLRYSALEWLLLCSIAYSIACHHIHAQQTRIACMARERSELEAKESLAQAQVAKLQQQLQELQFSYAAERSRSEQLESKVCELKLAVRNKDLQLAEFQSVTEKEAMRPTGLGEEVNETAKETPHWDEQNGSDGSGNPDSPDAQNCDPQQILPEELLPLVLGFFSAYEVCQLGIRAVSRFFSDPKAWISLLVKLVDIDSLRMSLDSEKSHPLTDWVATRYFDTMMIRAHLQERPTSDVGLNCWMCGLRRWHRYEPELVLHFVQVVLECRVHTDITAMIAARLDAVIEAIASIHTTSYTFGSQIPYGMLEVLRSTKRNESSLLSALQVLLTCTSTFHLDKDFLIECTKTVLSFVDKDDIDLEILDEGLLVIDQMARGIFECDLDRFGSFRWCVTRFLRKRRSYDARIKS